MRPDLVTIALDHRIIEHPQAAHFRKMRAAIWLYLVLLARLKTESAVDIEPGAVATATGLPEGTIRSWLGHLAKSRYVDVERRNGGFRVTVRGIQPPKPVDAPAPPHRAFSVEGLARSLGDGADRNALDEALDEYSDDAIRKALAGALAVPDEKIRRSRTALFLYLLKRHEQDD